MRRFGDIRTRMVVLLAAAALFAGSLLLASVGRIYVSPDETANAFFAERFARTSTLSFVEPLNAIADGRIHPRSTEVVEGKTVPGSFLGLPVLYGLVAAIIGVWVLPLLTACVAALAVVAWYGVVRRVFGATVGVLATVLLATHPAWWYYTSRGFMHNVLFTSLLVFAVYAVVARPVFARVRRPESLRVFGDAALAGLCVGLALFVRTSEVLWVLPLCVLLPLVGFPKTIWRRGVKQVCTFVVFLGLSLVPMFALNGSTYGSPFENGYTVTTDTQLAVPDTEIESLLPTISTSTVPTSRLGTFDWHATKANTKYYLLGLFWWLTLLCLMGAPHVLGTRTEPSARVRAKRTYLVGTAVAAFVLVPLYGSWTFFDNPDPAQITIGNSHIRYWLPLFVLSTPFAATGIVWLTSFLSSRALRALLSVVVVFACALAGTHVAAFAPQDGLLVSRAGLETSRAIREEVLSVVEEQAVVIVDRADKLFFPYRQVLYPLRDEATYALMPKLVLRVPLYYYGITLPPQDIEYLNTDKLAELGLRIDLVAPFGIESLYRITPASGIGL